MMNLDFIKGLQTLIIAFLSYIITITFAGFFESYVAKKVGDDTPEQAGFLTLNPLDHFNVFGFAALLWGLFYGNLLPIQLIPGWGRLIPLSPDQIQGRNCKFRVLMEFLARSVAHLIALLTVVILLILYSVFVLDVVRPFMISVKATSFVESIMTLLRFVYDQNLILFFIHFIVGLFQFSLHIYGKKLHYRSTFEKFVIGLSLLIIAMYILIPLLQAFVFLVIKFIQIIILKIRLFV